MAGNSSLGLWSLTLGNSAAQGGYFDDAVLTLYDAAGVAHAYQLPRVTTFITLPVTGSLFSATPTGAVGASVASQSPAIAGSR